MALSRKRWFVRFLKWPDLVMAATAVTALALLYVSLWQPAGQAAELQVLVDNEPLLSAPLSHNQNFTVEGALGLSELEIRDGKVRFVSSPCRNQVCVHHGWASHSGELLACLPNRIALVLEGEAAVNDIDAVNF